MRISAYLGVPTLFYFDALELDRDYYLISALLEDLEQVKLYNGTSAWTYKGFSKKTLYAKGTALKGGFLLNKSFYGDVFDLCQAFKLYYTSTGFSPTVVRTGNFYTGNFQVFKTPFFIGDTLNNQLITAVDYNFNNAYSTGVGYVGFSDNTGQ